MYTKKLFQVPPRIKLGSLDSESRIMGPRMVLLVYADFLEINLYSVFCY